MEDAKRNCSRDLVILIFFPVIITVGIGILWSFLMSFRDNPDTASPAIIWCSMGAGMLGFPVWYLRKTAPEQCTFHRLGLQWNFPRDGISVLAVTAGLTLLKKMILHSAMLPAFLQNAPIAVCEEFWCKSILFLKLGDVFPSRRMVVFCSAAVFAFVTHAGESMLDNLLIRLPFGLLTGWIYHRTDRLFWPVALHLSYNMLIT